MQQLSGQDAMFIYPETKKAPNIAGGFITYDPSTAPGGRVTFEQFLSHVEARLPELPMLRRKLVRVPFDLDHPYWVDDPEFDLEYHVRDIALPRPGDWGQLCKQVARLMARPLDPARPLWEIYMIEGLDSIPDLPEGSFASVLKLHHAAVDGVAGRELSSVLHTSTPEVVHPEADDWDPEPQPSNLDLMARTARNYAVRPARMASAMARTFPAVARMSGQMTRGRVRPQELRVPRTRFNGVIDAHRTLDACDFDLAEMKRMKGAVPGATINDVVLAVIAGGLRRYLQGKGELPTDPLVAMIPVSLRTDDQSSAGGNQVTTMRATLATDVADPVERLKVIHASTEHAKELGQLVDARTLVAYSEFLPGALVGLGGRAMAATGLAARGAPFVNVPITNIPGPQQPLYLAGARFHATYGIPPIMDGMGLIHLVHSYCGRLFVSAWSSPKILPDIEVYVDDIRASFDELAAATQ